MGYILILCAWGAVRAILEPSGPAFSEKVVLFGGCCIVILPFLVLVISILFSTMRDMQLVRHTWLTKDGIWLGANHSQADCYEWSSIASLKEKHSRLPGIRPSTKVLLKNGGFVVIPRSTRGYTHIIEFVSWALQEKRRSNDLENRYAKILQAVLITKGQKNKYLFRMGGE
jgi:hypothetical protein